MLEQSNIRTILHMYLLTGFPLLTPGTYGTISSTSGALIEFSLRRSLSLVLFIFSDPAFSQWYKHLMLAGTLES